MLPEVFTPQFVARLEALRLRSRRRSLALRSGEHAGARHGGGIEFADYRPYAPGDDFRSVDWNLYARADRLFVKLFQAEAELRCELCVDASASMVTPDRTKLDAARDLALALAYVVLSGHDSVRTHILRNRGGRSTPFFRSRAHLTEIQRFFDSAKPGGRLDWREALVSRLGQATAHGLALLITDGLQPLAEWEEILRFLLATRHEPALLQVLGRADREPPLPSRPVMALDSEGGGRRAIRFDSAARRLYAGAFSRHLDGLRKLCLGSGIPYACHTAGDHLPDFVLTVLPRLGLLR